MADKSARDTDRGVVDVLLSGYLQGVVGAVLIFALFVALVVVWPEGQIHL